MIYLRSEREIELISESNRINYETLMLLKEQVEPGVKTKELDNIAEEYIRSHDAEPAFKGYRGFPASICTSINEEVVHGIPSDRELKEGDILSVDVGVEKNGYFGDAAYTYKVGEVEDKIEKLLEVTKDSLYKGIEKAVNGNNLSDIGSTVQDTVEEEGYSVVRELVGHGIGRNLHEDPEIPNFGEPGEGPKLKEGMCLAIEPMVNMGGYEVETLEDKWTVVSKDGSRSAHFEHTITISENGPVILADKKIKVN